MALQTQPQASAPGKGNLTNLKGFFGFGEDQMTKLGDGSIGQRPVNRLVLDVRRQTDGAGKSPAALMGGTMLLMNGLRRGGKLGMADSAGGGALIGFKHSGPQGAAIGAVAGAVAGAIRMGIETKDQEAIRLVKALYGVSIDRAMPQQIVDIAKQRYSGHVSMAVRYPDVLSDAEGFGSHAAGG